MVEHTSDGYSSTLNVVCTDWLYTCTLGSKDASSEEWECLQWWHILACTSFVFVVSLLLSPLRWRRLSAFLLLFALSKKLRVQEKEKKPSNYKTPNTPRTLSSCIIRGKHGDSHVLCCEDFLSAVSYTLQLDDGWLVWRCRIFAVVSSLLPADVVGSVLR